MTVSEAAGSTEVECQSVTFISWELKALGASLVAEKESNWCLPLSAVCLSSVFSLLLLEMICVISSSFSLENRRRAGKAREGKLRV